MVVAVTDEHPARSRSSRGKAGADNPGDRVVERNRCSPGCACTPCRTAGGGNGAPEESFCLSLGNPLPETACRGGRDAVGPDPTPPPWPSRDVPAGVFLSIRITDRVAVRSTSSEQRRPRDVDRRFRPKGITDPVQLDQDSKAELDHSRLKGIKAVENLAAQGRPSTNELPRRCRTRCA